MSVWWRGAWALFPDSNLLNSTEGEKAAHLRPWKTAWLHRQSHLHTVDKMLNVKHKCTFGNAHEYHTHAILCPPPPLPSLTPPPRQEQGRLGGVGLGVCRPESGSTRTDVFLAVWLPTGLLDQYPDSLLLLPATPLPPSLTVVSLNLNFSFPFFPPDLFLFFLLFFLLYFLYFHPLCFPTCHQNCLSFQYPLPQHSQSAPALALIKIPPSPSPLISAHHSFSPPLHQSVTFMAAEMLKQQTLCVCVRVRVYVHHSQGLLPPEPEHLTQCKFIRGDIIDCKLHQQSFKKWTA